jgi:hypothetical protein
MKVCITCGEKPVEAFYRQKGGAQGRRCKKCFRVEARAAYARNPEVQGAPTPGPREVTGGRAALSNPLTPQIAEGPLL